MDPQLELPQFKPSQPRPRQDYLPEREGGEPESEYGRSKLRQSSLALEMARASDIDLLRVRLFNTLGPGQSTALVGGALVARLARAVCDMEKTLTVTDAESVRDFMDVRDVARCLLLLARSLPRDPERPPVNLCSGEGLSVAGLAGELVAASGAAVQLAWAPGRAAPTRFVGACDVLRELVDGRMVRRISTLESLRDMWMADVEKEAAQ